MLAYLQGVCPGFPEYGKHAGFIFRLKRDIFAMDSTLRQLSLASIDWARHRRRKAVAKCHVRLNIGTFLPTFVVSGTRRITTPCAPACFAPPWWPGMCCWPTASTSTCSFCPT